MSVNKPVSSMSPVMHVHEQGMLFPPFELDKYRLIFLENSNSLVRIVIKADPAFLQSVYLERRLRYSYARDCYQLTEIILRIILSAERSLQASDIHPPKFVLKGKGYTCLVETPEWKIPESYTFQHRINQPNYQSSIAFEHLLNPSDQTWTDLKDDSRMDFGTDQKTNDPSQSEIKEEVIVSEHPYLRTPIALPPAIDQNEIDSKEFKPDSTQTQMRMDMKLVMLNTWKWKYDITYAPEELD